MGGRKFKPADEPKKKIEHCIQKEIGICSKICANTILGWSASDAVGDVIEENTGIYQTCAHVCKKRSKYRFFFGDQETVSTEKAQKCWTEGSL